MTAAVNYYRSTLLYGDQQPWKRKAKKTLPMPTLVVWVRLDSIILRITNVLVQKCSVALCWP